jgi:hypothetical protein
VLLGLVGVLLVVFVLGCFGIDVCNGLVFMFCFCL